MESIVITAMKEFIVKYAGTSEMTKAELETLRNEIKKIEISEALKKKRNVERNNNVSDK